MIYKDLQIHEGLNYLKNNIIMFYFLFIVQK
jgi:hypothetical protein